VLITGKSPPEKIWFYDHQLTHFYTPKLCCDHVQWRILSLTDSCCSRIFQKTSPSDVVVWTDGSFRSPLGAVGAGVHAACRRCFSSSSLSCSADPVISSFSVESLALVYGLEWCHHHLKTCTFNRPFSKPTPNRSLPFFQPKSFGDIWNLSDSLSFRVALRFQWVLGHLVLPCKELKTRSPKPEQHSPSPSKDKAYPLYDLETKSFSQFTLLPDSFGFLGGTGLSSSCSLWTVTTSLPRSQPSLAFFPMQDKTERSFFLQHLQTPSAGFDSPPPGLSRIQASSAHHLLHYFFHFWPLSRSWGVARLLGRRWVPPRPIHQKGSGGTTTTTTRRAVGQFYNRTEQFIWHQHLTYSHTLNQNIVITISAKSIWK